jgi:prepilin-type N-terminal cleavage/methylation domain-containing protein
VTKHRSPHNRSSDAGFTALELLAGLVIIGIISAIAIPNIASMYKPLSTAVSSTTSQLTLIRSKAMASSRAYRIRPRYATAAAYPGGKPNDFIVQYNKDGGSCNQTNPDKWGFAPQFDFKLADRVILGNLSALGDGVCFDSRGIPKNTTGVDFVLFDEQRGSQARSSKISVNGTGGVSYKTYSTDDGTGTEIAGKKF